MGESLISRAVSGASGGNGGYVFITEVVQESKVWIAPEARNQSFSVRIFGGGGAGSFYSKNSSYVGCGGGGGGWMNNSILNIPNGTPIDIVIGAGGLNGTNSSVGGTTIFGSYLSANGGTSGESGLYVANGGSGGSGGGSYGSGISNTCDGYGGTGYQFGGGCGISPNKSRGSAGNGGLYGGGGGLYSYKNDFNNYGIGIGGTYGGNGGANVNNGINYTAENGTNTIKIESAFLSGAGLPGTNYGGGGGYGGNGGNNCGGGGGYGKCGVGGNGGSIDKDNSITGYKMNCCGGGGGYGPGGSCGGNGGIAAGGSGIAISSYNNAIFNTPSGGNGICIIQYYAPIQRNSFEI